MIQNEIVAALADPAFAASVLDAVADQHGDARYRRAAGLLRGRQGGRPAHPDDGALKRIAALLKDGSARSPAQAARFIARTLPGEKSTEAAAIRLASKFRSREEK